MLDWCRSPITSCRRRHRSSLSAPNREHSVSRPALELTPQFSAYEGGGAFMNRTTPLPLTGGVPQPLTELSQCIISAECTSGSGRSTRQPR